MKSLLPSIGIGSFVSRRAAAVLIAVSLGSAAPNSYAVNLFFDFDTEAEFDNNFLGTSQGSQIAYDSGPGVGGDPGFVNFTLSNTTAVLLYDTDGNGSTIDPIGLADTISTNFRFDNFASSIGIQSRIQESTDLGIMAHASFAASDEIRIRLFYGASYTSSTPGTAFYDMTFSSLTNTVSLNDFSLLATFTQSADPDPVFNFTISDSDGFIAGTGNQTLLSSQSDAYDAAGGFSLRMSTPGSAPTTDTDIDNVTVIPEPATGLLLWGGLAALFASRRRYRLGIVRQT